MSIEIPTDLQPAIAAAVASGEYQSEQELESEILRAAVPMLGQYTRIEERVRDTRSFRRAQKARS